MNLNLNPAPLNPEAVRHRVPGQGRRPAEAGPAAQIEPEQQAEVEPGPRPPRNGAVRRGAIRRGPGYFELLSKALVGMLALSAGYRLVRTPGDFVNDPVGAAVGTIMLTKPVTQPEIERYRADFGNAFGRWIPPDRLACAAVPMHIQRMMLPIGGMYRHGPRDIVINRDHLPFWHVEDVVKHELAHACMHDNFGAALKKLDARLNRRWQPREDVTAKALEEGLTEVLTQRGGEKGLFQRLTSMLGASNSGYASLKLPDGTDWVTAAENLVNAVGLETAARAYFGGDPAAIRTLMAASQETHQKHVRTSWTA